VDSPDNIGTFQAVIRKISSFEIIDGDILKENIWDFDLEEEIDFYLRAAGVDSEYVFNTLGLPLYIFVIAMILAPLLLLVNLCIRTGCSYEDDQLESESE
jgi:hypothetical protein